MKTARLTLSSKGQVTIPASFLREKKLHKGAKLQARWEDDQLVLAPERDLRKVVEEINAELKPLIRKPLTDKELEENLRNWPKDKDSA